MADNDNVCNVCKNKVKRYQDSLANAIYDIGARSKPELVKHSVELLGSSIKDVGACLEITETLDFKRALRNWELTKEATERRDFTKASFELASTASVLARAMFGEPAHRK